MRIPRYLDIAPLSVVTFTRRHDVFTQLQSERVGRLMQLNGIYSSLSRWNAGWVFNNPPNGIASFLCTNITRWRQMRSVSVLSAKKKSSAPPSKSIKKCVRTIQQSNQLEKNRRRKKTLSALSLDEALYVAAEAGIGTRKEMEKRILTSPSFSRDSSPFLLENVFATQNEPGVDDANHWLPECTKNDTLKPQGVTLTDTAVTPDNARLLKAPQSTKSLCDPQSKKEEVKEAPAQKKSKSGSEDAVTEAIAAQLNPPALKKFWHNSEEFLEVSEGRGTCKRACAHVRLYQGTGKIHFYTKKECGSLANVFPFHYLRRLVGDAGLYATCSADILKPFELTNTCGIYDVYAHCKGGGFGGKAHALRLAIGRALVTANPSNADILRQGELLLWLPAMYGPLLHASGISYQTELILHEDVRQRWPKVPRRRGARKAKKFRKR